MRGSRWLSRSVPSLRYGTGVLAALLLAAAGTSVATTATAAGPPVLTVDPNPAGPTLANGSVGLSFEASDLALPGFTAGNLAQYLKTLGSSVIRIGGNTVDQTYWTSSGETPPSWSIATITPADLTALDTLAKASGWQVILGVNLKQYDPARAADEVRHATAALGSSLRAVEIGNEPDLYPQYQGDTGKYFTDFETYVKAIEAAAPGVSIVGSDASGAPNSSFQNTFVGKEKALGTPDITELTNHYYPLTSSTCGGNPTVTGLLGTGVRNAEKAEGDAAAAQARSIGLPDLVDEGNSVVCEGQDGVSNVFAAALWVVDESLVLAREGAAGSYLHGTVLQCNTAKPLFMYYTPLCAPTASDAAAGTLAAQPLYYGLAAVHAIGGGQFLNVGNDAWATVRGYALRHSDGSLVVVLDNVSDPATADSVQLHLGGTYHAGKRLELTASGLTAKSGITLGGRSVGSDGTLPALKTTPVAVDGSSLTVTVPAATAEVLTFTP
jgi:hypothetical protein